MTSEQIAELEITKTMVQIKRDFLENIFQIMLALTFVGLPTSLLRIYDFGFHPVYVFQVLLGIFTILLFFVRKRLDPLFLALYEVFAFFSLAFTGLIQFGLFSSALFFIADGIFIISVYFGLRAGILSLGSVSLLIMVIYQLWTHNNLSPPVPLEEYSRSPLSWIVTTVVMIFSSGVFTLPTVKLLKGYRALIKKVNNMAAYDPLTSLLNLNYFMQRVDHAIALSKRNKTKTALLFLDLDGFKQVNDTQGHEAGDLVLQEVSARLQKSIREVDAAGRIGGDEFLILLSEVHDKAGVEIVCQRIIEEIQKPIGYHQTVLFVGVSIGGALYPDHADTSLVLRKVADQKMYQVKATGKNNYLIA